MPCYICAAECGRNAYCNKCNKLAKCQICQSYTEIKDLKKIMFFNTCYGCRQFASKFCDYTWLPNYDWYKHCFIHGDNKPNKVATIDGPIIYFKWLDPIFQKITRFNKAELFVGFICDKIYYFTEDFDEDINNIILEKIILAFHIILRKRINLPKFICFEILNHYIM